MYKRWVILNKFRGVHKWNMHISGRGTSLQMATKLYWIKLIDNVKWTQRLHSISCFQKLNYTFSIPSYIIL